MNNSKDKIITVLSFSLAIALIAVAFLGYLLFTKSKQSVGVTPEWRQEAISEKQASEKYGYDPEFMQLAITLAKENTKGGPIGAVIVKDGAVVAKATNEYAISGFAHSHAELCAIRDAVKALGTNKLDGCVLYTSSQPCLMCESAIAGSNVGIVYYAATLEDMMDNGWDDIVEYETIREGKNLIPSYAIDVANKLDPIKAWKKRKSAD